MYHIGFFVVFSSEYIPVYEIKYHSKLDNTHLNLTETETALSARYTKPES